MHVKPEAMQSATESIARLCSWISSKSRPASGQLPTDSQSALKPATLETGQARIRTVGAISPKKLPAATAAGVKAESQFT